MNTIYNCTIGCESLQCGKDCYATRSGRDKSCHCVCLDNSNNPCNECSEDMDEACPLYARTGNCEYFKDQCKRSCSKKRICMGQCPGDVHEKCPEWAEKGACKPESEYHELMLNLCPRTCFKECRNECPNDTSPQCPDWARNGFCTPESPHHDIMVTDCPRSCNVKCKTSCDDKHDECPKMATKEACMYENILPSCSRSCMNNCLR